MTAVDKTFNYVADCAERKIPYKKVAEKAISELEQIAKDARYTSPFAETGEKVAGQDLAEAYRAYNTLEEGARKAVAEANEQLAKTPKAQEFADPSQYLG